MLNVTTPFVPVLSTGKLPDFSPFAAVIQKSVEQAVARAHRATRQPGKPSRKDDDDGTDSYQTGKLHRVIRDAAAGERCNIGELTVLSEGKNPYLFDRAAGHRVGRWCAQMIARFLAPDGRIHIRGFHYVLSSAGGVTRPNGRLYVNDNQTWEWLSDIALKSARWLGHVSFDRIVDERNAPSELYLPPYYECAPERSKGEEIIIPDLGKAVPGFTSEPWPVVQPFRIILIGEKVSLRPVLLPIAQMVGGELFLPTGEPSETRIAELATRCAHDPRAKAYVPMAFTDQDGKTVATDQ